MNKPQDTMDAIKGIKRGLFEGYAYRAEYFFGDNELPDRWEVVAVDPVCENDVEWEYRLYRYLNPSLFKTELDRHCWATTGSETWIEGIQAERLGGNNHYGRTQCSPSPGETCPACGYTWPIE